MLTIRWACEADCALIRRLADEVFPATYRGSITPSQMEYMMEWMYGAEVLAREMCGEFAWFIASADGEPCGYLSVQHEAEDLFHLQKIYVLPRFQGIGAGEFLFRHAVEYIRSVHPAPCRMELNVNRNNRALHFYERMGMRKLREGDFPIGVGVRFFAWRPVAGDLARLLAPPGLPESSVAGLLPDAGIRLP